MKTMLALLPLALIAAVPDRDTTFDFMAGDWVLYDASGKPVGSSHIVADAAGAMLSERRTIDGQPPQPLWFANSAREGGWTEMFVGPDGQVRAYARASAPGAWPIVLTTELASADGGVARYRLTVTRDGNDRVRRTLETSRDRGRTWSTVFDLDYRRKKPS